MRKLQQFINNQYVLATVKKAVTILCAVLSTSFLSRFLGPELKGDYSYFFSILNIAVIITQFGLFKLYAQEKREKTDGAGHIFFSMVTIKFIALMIFSALLSLVLLKSELPKYYSLLPAMVCINAFQGELVFLLLIDKFKKTTIITAIGHLINTLLLFLAFALLKSNLYVALAIFAAKDVAVIVLCICSGGYRLILDRRIWGTLKKYRNVIFFPALAALLLDFNSKLDVIFLKQMSTSYIVGLYSAAVSLSEIAWMVPDIFKEVLFYRTAVDDSVRSINTSLRLSNVVVLLFCIVVILFGKPIIRLLFGSSYNDSYIVSLILLLGVHSMAIFKILNPLYQARGQWKLYTLTLVFGVITNTVLNYLLIPIMGGSGAAVASVFSYAVCGGILLACYIRDYHLSAGDVLFPKRKDFAEILNEVKALREDGKKA